MNEQELIQVPVEHVDAFSRAAIAIAPRHLLNAWDFYDGGPVLLYVSPPLAPSQQLLWDIAARRLTEELGL